MDCPSWCDETEQHELHQAEFHPWLLVQADGEAPSVVRPFDELAYEELEVVSEQLTRIRVILAS